MLKRNLIKLLREIRPKADAYDRVCQQLGIDKDILGYIENLQRKHSSKSICLHKDEESKIVKRGKLLASTEVKQQIANHIDQQGYFIDIDKFFHSDGSHITKIEYGRLLINEITKDLRNISA